MSRIKLALVGLLAFATLGCRQDMHNQPRYKALAESSFWGDQRSERPMVADTVARGYLELDEARYTGKVNGQDVDYFPWKVTKDDIRLGQYRFNIYCSPCHSRLGDGNGMIVQRGYRKAGNYHTPKLMKAPVGHFFDVVTNGFGAMPSYASRVSVDDRWRIIAYIRALQLSEAATLNDVPSDVQAELKSGGPRAVVQVTDTPTASLNWSPPRSVANNPGHPELPAPFSGEIAPSYRATMAASQGGQK